MQDYNELILYWKECHRNLLESVKVMGQIGLSDSCRRTLAMPASRDGSGRTVTGLLSFPAILPQIYTAVLIKQYTFFFQTLPLEFAADSGSWADAAPVMDAMPGNIRVEGQSRHGIPTCGHCIDRPDVRSVRKWPPDRKESGVRWHRCARTAHPDPEIRTLVGLSSHGQSSEIWDKRNMKKDSLSLGPGPVSLRPPKKISLCLGIPFLLARGSACFLNKDWCV